MAYWQWTPDLELGIEAIDRQHRRLVEYINELDLARRARDKDRVETVLIGLLDYAVTHFAFEEELLEHSGYPLAAPHRAIHQSFTERAHKHLRDHRQGRDVGNQVMSELQVWLSEHIQRDDRDYVPVVREALAQRGRPGWLERTVRRLFG